MNKVDADEILDYIDNRIQELIKGHKSKEVIDELASLSLKIQQIVREAKEELEE